MLKVRIHFSHIFKRIAIGLLVALLVLVFSKPAFAATGILKQINFQGKVVNANGTNVANGNYDFQFKIYTAASGGSPIWTETWNSGTSQVTVTDGIFRVALGTYTAFPGSIDFNTDNIYLSINFNSDGEMDPRIRFAAVPYAFNALKVAGLTVTDTTGTFTLAAGKTLTVNNTLTFAGTDATTITFQGTDTYVGRATTDTLTNKTIGSTGLIFSGATTDITTAAGEALIITPNGAAALTLGTTGAGNTTSITLATDSTGDGEVVLPDNAIGTAEINDGSDTPGDEECLTYELTGTVFEWQACGSGGGIVTVRESDLSPSVGSLTTLEFGPASTSEDEFIVTDQTGGVARVVIGNKVGKLNEAETVTAGWTFNTTATTFTTGINANGGLTTSTTDTALAFTVNGAGDYTFASDSDSNFQINATPTTDATLNSAVITLNPTGTGSTGTLQGLLISQSDNANTGVYDSLLKLENLKTPETTTNGLLIEQNAASGILTNGLQVLSTAGTLTSGLLIADGAGTTTNGIQLTGTFATSLLDTPTLDITAAGNITGVAASITGAGGLTITPAAASGLTLGTTGGGNTTSITLATDSTGDAEVVLPAQSISAGEILNDTLTTTQLNATLTFSALDFVDLALIVHNTTANQGLRLPNAASATPSNPTSGEGYLAWDTAGNQLITYNGAAWATVGGGGGTLQTAYDAASGNTILTTTARNIAFTLGEVATPTSLTLENQDTAGVSAQRIFNSIASGTLTNGLLIEQTGAGTLTNGIQVLSTAGTLTSGILIADGAGTTVTGLSMTGTFTNLIDTPNFDVSNAGNLDAGGTITAGSGNVALTNAAGNIIHDALTDCAEGQILKWTAAGGWACAADAGGALTDLVYKAKSNNQSVTNNATLVDETALQFTIGADEEWNVIWTLQVTNGNSAGPDWKSAVVNAGSTCTATLGGVEPAGAVFPQATTTDCIEAPGNLVNGTIVADASVPFQVYMYANITGDATPDAVKMQFAHNTATSGVALTVKAGSTMIAYKVTGADLAESYYTQDPTLMAGDVVSLDSTIGAGVKKTSRAYDSETIGVISSKPGLVLGDSTNITDRPVFVALSGRVPVKVTTENGPIRAGDYLTSSSIPGIAMKATKSGVIIGQSMTAFDGAGLGAVTVFIKNGQGNGAKLADLLPGLTQDGTQPSVNDVGKMALAQLIEQKEELAASVDLSEMVTDRLAAGLEVITPKVVTQELTVDKIQASIGSDIVLNLTTDGKFVVKNEKGEQAVTFDSQGNAYFAGVVTANKVKANQIEGLEIITSQISKLNPPVADQNDNLNLKTEELEVQIAGVSTSSAGLSTSEVDQEVLFETGKFNLDLTVLGALNANGGLIVLGPSEFGSQTAFKGDSIFHALAEFIGSVIFRGDVAFLGRPTFNKDTGGFAVIERDADFVDITLEKEYETTPIVSTNFTFEEFKKEDGTADDQSIRRAKLFEQGYTFMVVNRTKKGFTIVLNKKATEDIAFSWVALAVKDAKTSLGKKPVSQIKAEALPTLMPTSSPTPEASITSEASPSADTN